MSTLPVGSLTERHEALFAIKGRLVLEGALVSGAVVIRDGKIAEVIRDLAGASLPETVVEAPAQSVASPLTVAVGDAFTVSVALLDKVAPKAFNASALAERCAASSCVLSSASSAISSVSGQVRRGCEKYVPR